MLYLLHGGCDSCLSWTRFTDVESLSRNLDALVGMPDGGAVGFYANSGAGAQWETFHTAELPQLLAEHYRDADAAAVADGLMGGLGALSCTARPSDLFTAAASFRGITHTTLSANVSQGHQGLVRSQGEDPARLGATPTPGPSTTLTTSRRGRPGVKPYVSARNGEPGPVDPDVTVADSIEAVLGVENEAFAHRTRELGLDIEVDLYGPGSQAWPNWQREPRRARPILTKAPERR